MITKIKFTKMQAYGNDYVYINAIEQPINNPNRLARKISDRHFGVGSDGMVLICPSERCDFRMRMFNPDGTEGEMCGNALRSLSKFVYYHKLTKKTELTIETLGGTKHVILKIENGEVINITANIGKPELHAKKIPVAVDTETFIEQRIMIDDEVFLASSLSWGNPHTVIFMEDIENFEVEKYGPAIEHLTDVFPKKTNVTFAQIVTPTYIKIREWERGTGETLGCGTGCCTAVVIGNILGKCGRVVEVEQLGGMLNVFWDEMDYVHMTGPSHVVFEGEYNYETK